jgi:drug/metabolite transporter (DMT)-like permease
MDRQEKDWEKEARFYTNPKVFYFLVIVVHFLWAVAVPLTKLGYAAFGIGGGNLFQLFTYAGLRLFFAGLLALAFCAVRKQKLLPDRKIFFQLLKLGLLMSVLQYVLLYIGTAYASGVVASILASSGAFFGILFSSLVFREDKLTPRKVLGCLLGVCAVIILNINDIRAGFAISVFGGLCVAMSQAAGTLGAVYLKVVSQGRDAIWIGGWQSFLGGCVLMAAGWCGGGTLALRGSAGDIWSSVILFLSAGLALIISNQLYKYNPLSKVVIFSLLLPAFGVLTSALLLGESLASLPVIFSLLLDCAGVGLVTVERKDGKEGYGKT